LLAGFGFGVLSLGGRFDPGGGVDDVYTELDGGVGEFDMNTMIGWPPHVDGSHETIVGKEQLHSPPCDQNQGVRRLAKLFRTNHFVRNKMKQIPIFIGII
jgi:hypothetical protein